MSRRSTRGLVGGLILMLTLAGCQDPAHDADTWTGVPWELQDADLPNDATTIDAWMNGVSGPGVWTLPLGDVYRGEQVLDLSFEDGGGGEVRAAPLIADRHGFYCAPSCAPTVALACDPCRADDMMAEIADAYEPIEASLDPSSPLIFVATAIDTQDYGGGHGVHAIIYFARPGGHWVFSIDAGNVDDVHRTVHALFPRVSGGS